MSFVPLTEPPPPRGVATAVARGVRRLVADNASAMTYHGTNTYLLDDADGTMVLDPGPDDATHVAAILAASRRISHILVSHGHADHAGAVPALAAATGVPVLRFGEGLGDGSAVGEWTALHTPGHAPDHLCFARADGVVLTADHVLSFSTSVVIPPEGDMAAYMAGLKRFLARTDTRYLPGHGPPIDDPAGFTAALLAHRLTREAGILARLGERPLATAALVTALYGALDPRLHGFAEASVRAHLVKLRAEGRAAESGSGWGAVSVG